MARTPVHPFTRTIGFIAALSPAMLLGACADTAGLLSGEGTQLANNSGADTAGGNSELKKATDYWGKQYQGNPADKTAALSYAKNLKAMGDKRSALAVLQDSVSIHSNDPEVAGEYGRLALEFDQLAAAQHAIQVAEAVDNPDWRVVSAHGTLLAKQGQHKAAIPYFERALQLSPNQPSVLNNLAMATAMSGDPKSAEDILKRIPVNANAPAQVNQNLALVLGLQGKYDEAKSAGAKSGSSDIADANTEYVRRMVRLAPQKSAAPSTAVANAAGAGTTGFKGAAVETGSATWDTSVSTASVTPAFRGSSR